jgi:hypothetical protein
VKAPACRIAVKHGGSVARHSGEQNSDHFPFPMMDDALEKDVIVVRFS